jgi:hypothetical protein
MYSSIFRGELCSYLKNGLYAVNRIFCYLDFTADANKQESYVPPWRISRITNY